MASEKWEQITTILSSNLTNRSSKLSITNKKDASILNIHMFTVQLLSLPITRRLNSMTSRRDQVRPIASADFIAYYWEINLCILRRPVRQDN